jgi:hypothetical protein
VAVPAAAASDASSITEPFTMPTGDRGRLDQHESLPPPGPEPSQAHPEQTVRRAEASIRTREYTQLMAQGKKLEEQVATREQGRPEGRDRPEGLTHRL